MDLEIAMLMKEIRERQISYDNCVYMESKKMLQMNLFTKQK